MLRGVFARGRDFISDITMSRRRGKEYEPLPNNDLGFVDAQFLGPPQKIPWKAVTLAAFLFIVGSALLIIGSLMVSGHLVLQYSDRMWPMIVLGALMFIPGAYHVRIAYYAYKKVPGYSFDDIPEFD